MIEFTIPVLSIGLNRIYRLHWAQRKKYQTDLAWHIKAAIPDHRLRDPIEHAWVHVQRRSVKVLDYDNLIGGFKHLIDCLVLPGPRHKNGLGIIVDDDPDHLRLTGESVKVRHFMDQNMTIKIYDLDSYSDMHQSP